MKLTKPMKLPVLAILLGVANPACAQLDRHVMVEQASSKISGELVEPLYKPKSLDSLPIASAPLIIEQPKQAFRTRTADKPFWLHASAFAGSVALDAWSSSRFVNYNRSHPSLRAVDPGICTEGNRSLGLMPSDGRIASYFAAWTGSEVAATYLLKRFTRHAKSQWVRESWRFPITYLSAYHSYWGVHNLAACK